MATNGKSAVDNNLVVLQLSGGNDYLNTIVPYTNGFIMILGRALR